MPSSMGIDFLGLLHGILSFGDLIQSYCTVRMGQRRHGKSKVKVAREHGWEHERGRKSLRNRGERTGLSCRKEGTALVLTPPPTHPWLKG